MAKNIHSVDPDMAPGLQTNKIQQVPCDQTLAFTVIKSDLVIHLLIRITGIVFAVGNQPPVQPIRTNHLGEGTGDQQDPSFNEEVCCQRSAE